jgi:chaperonin GroEL (HSP60 family)
LASRVLTGARARRALIAPLAQSVRAINASLGPHGRALLYEPSSGGVGFAADGLAIAREMAESEGAQSIGPRILKETLYAAERDLGDGAARLACIFGAVLESGARLVAGGLPPQALADDILHIGRIVDARLADQRLEAPELAALAGAAVADNDLAMALADAVGHAGADGVVDVKEHPRDGIHVETGRGFVFDAALASPHLGPDPPATGLELDEVSVLVANEIISEFGRLGPILDGFASRKKSLVIVARDVIGGALAALVRNRRELGLHIAGLKPTDVGTRAGEVIADLAAATGATLIGAELGVSLDAMRPTMLGRARRMRFAMGRALFAEPAGDRAAVAARRAWLAGEAERARYLAYDREHALRRSARLAGRWSAVSVGGRNTFETAARLAEARAAVHALQAALRSGVVAGGGSALVRVAAGLRGESTEMRAARLCVMRGLEQVLAHIARNAGLNPAVPLARLRASTRLETGFDARSGLIGNIVAAGIADPASITAGVVSRALSAAATLLRVEALVCR